MSPGEWLVAFRRAWLGMLTIFLVCVIGSGVLLLATPPTYEAEAEIVFSTDTGATNLVPRTVATNAAARARSESVLASVADEFDVDRRALFDGVSATWRPDTSITVVTMSHTDPRLAADLATAIAETVADEAGTDVRARAYDAAEPQSPVRPLVATTLAVGTLLGIALAFIYAALRFALTRRVRSLEDAADLSGLPAYAWPSREPSHARSHEIQLVIDAWAGDERVVTLMPVDAAIDTTELARTIEAGDFARAVVQLPPFGDDSSAPSLLSTEGALVLVVKVGQSSRRAVELLGHLRREGAARPRGVIVYGAATRRRATSAMIQPANGELA